LLPGVAAALGLGGIRTQSALNEPFYAEIDLVDARPDELDSIKVLLAPPEDFQRVGSTRAHFLTRLRFQPQVSPQGRPVILVTSSEPVREPFLDFLIELNWPQGRMVKGYTVLLDPPVTLDRRAPRVERPAAGSVATPSPGAGSQRPVGGIAPIPAGAGGGAFPLRYGPVESGAGLWRVARKLAPSGATVAQTAMALYRNNQGAFIRGDINMLRQGAVLEIPSAAELFALNTADAEREFRAAMRGDRVTDTPLIQVADGAPTEDRLRIATAPEAPAAPASPALTPPAGAIPEIGTLQQELLLVQEAGESTRQETEELRSRIRELETQLADIQRLLQLRNEQLAMVQAAQLDEPSAAVAEATEVEPLSPATEAAEPAMPPEVAEPLAEETETLVETEPMIAESEATPVAETESAVTEAESEVTPVAETESAVAAAGPEAAAPESEGVVVESEPVTAPTAEPEVAAIEEPVSAETQAPMPAPTGPELAAVSPSQSVPRSAAEAEGSRGPAWADAVTGSPLAIGGGLAALAALLGLIVVRRRRHLGEMVPEGAFAGAQGLAGAGAMHSSDDRMTDVAAKPAWADSRLTGGDSALMPPEGETEEADVVSEADVYIAYGRYREAQSLLEDELRRSPARVDLKLKLAEAYSGAKNVPALKYLMSDMERTGVHRLYPDQWDRLEKALAGLEAASAGDAAPTMGQGPSAADAAATPRGEPKLALGAATAATGAARADDLDLDLDALDLLGSTPSAPPAKPEAPATTTDLDLQREELDRFSEIDFGDSEVFEERPARPAAPAQASGPAALGDSFDLLMPLSKETGGSEAPSSQWQSDSGLWDEVTTKIDLARAYIEMEDPEAARVILQEVVAEGNASQQAEAREMLARIG
jgi:pilus assembly protein FimV